MRHNALMNEQQPARARRMTIRRHRMRIACLAVFLLVALPLLLYGWRRAERDLTRQTR